MMANSSWEIEIVETGFTEKGNLEICEDFVKWTNYPQKDCLQLSYFDFVCFG